MADCLYCDKKTKRDNMDLPKRFCTPRCAREYKKVFPGMAPTEPYRIRRKLLDTITAARYGDKGAQTAAYELGFRRLWNDRTKQEVLLEAPV